ncbi:MAG TPA: hypothetical protein VGG28_24335 [Kofleriaceae bacterium]|jgi:hypothetical protein
MAKLVLADGEHVLRRAAARDLGRPARETVLHELVLTDRRIVVLRTSYGPTLPSLGGLVSAILMAVGRVTGGGPRVEYAIARADVATVEVIDGTSLLVRSNGDGYAMTWFELKLGFADDWASLLQRWAAGEVFDATLPAATIVER